MGDPRALPDQAATRGSAAISPMASPPPAVRKDAADKRAI
jgi:hypothetical protein